MKKGLHVTQALWKDTGCKQLPGALENEDGDIYGRALRVLENECAIPRFMEIHNGGDKVIRLYYACAGAKTKRSYDEKRV